jgi:hypothetical protein
MERSFRKGLPWNFWEMNMTEKGIWSVDQKGSWGDGKLEEWQYFFMPSFH